MSENQAQQERGHGAHDVEHGDGHGPNHYRNIYLVLVVLFLISVAGPELGIRWVTLITAFAIAIVKANLVVQNFMHLNVEKRIMKWVLATSLLLMFLMVAGVSVDVLNHEGNNWRNVAALEATARGVAGEGAAEAEGEVETEVAVAAFNVESTYNIVCATCHGQAGDGSGPAGAALDPPPADFTDPAFWAERDMERIVQVIESGAASVGGSPLMVAWGASFTDEQIQELADYVATFRPNQ
jgi:caa(3)-type oxidase subunit IV